MPVVFYPKVQCQSRVTLYPTCTSGLEDSGGAVSLCIHLVTDLLARAGAGKLLDWQFTGTWGIHIHEGHHREVGNKLILAGNT